MKRYVKANSDNVIVFDYDNLPTEADVGKNFEVVIPWCVAEDTNYCGTYEDILKEFGDSASRYLTDDTDFVFPTGLVFTLTNIDYIGNDPCFTVSHEGHETSFYDDNLLDNPLWVKEV